MIAAMLLLSIGSMPPVRRYGVGWRDFSLFRRASEQLSRGIDRQRDGCHSIRPGSPIGRGTEGGGVMIRRVVDLCRSDEINPGNGWSLSIVA